MEVLAQINDRFGTHIFGAHGNPLFAVLIAAGGIGSAVDQLTLSKTLFEQHGVPIKGCCKNVRSEDPSFQF